MAAAGPLADLWAAHSHGFTQISLQRGGRPPCHAKLSQAGRATERQVRTVVLLTQRRISTSKLTSTYQNTMIKNDKCRLSFVL